MSTPERGQAAENDAIEAADSSDIDYDVLLEDMQFAALGAARIIRDASHRLGSIAWRSKSAADFVSEVDEEAERHLRQFLTARLPAAHFLGEEGSPDSRARRGLAWVVDPLDGTTNFLHGYPQYAVSVGLVEDGVPIAGVIHDVGREVTFSARRGGGAFRDGAPIRVSSITEPERALVGTGFPFKDPEHLRAYLPQMDAVARGTAGVRRAGSAALDLADVACGRFEAFWELSLAPWDVAAGLILIREAGGVATDLDGREADVAQGALIAGNPSMHRWILETLKAAGENWKKEGAA